MAEVISDLKIEAADCFEMLETAYQCTQYHNPEDERYKCSLRNWFPEYDIDKMFMCGLPTTSRSHTIDDKVCYEVMTLSCNCMWVLELLFTFQT
jgi:hypothetical protein